MISERAFLSVIPQILLTVVVIVTLLVGASATQDKTSSPLAVADIQSFPAASTQEEPLLYVHVVTVINTETGARTDVEFQGSYEIMSYLAALEVAGAIVPASVKQKVAKIVEKEEE